MRIALSHVFCWPEVRRGGERLVSELSRSLAALGHDVTRFSSAYEAGRRRCDGVREIRFRRWRHNEFAAETDFGVRLLPALATGRFHVVHSHGRRDGVTSLRAARLHPRRVTAHTDIGLPSKAWWSTHGKEAGYAARMVREADIYACLSQHALDVLATDWGRQGALLPGGVDLDLFRPAERRSDAPSILYSGALDVPRKGLATLLEALPLVARQEPEVRLLLSGQGDPEPLLAAAPSGARERTEVLGAGRVEDQPARYGKAWVCALPAKMETFGLVLVEALACGTPLVAADDSALPEVVTPGITGALCRHGDAPSIAEACLQAIELSRRPETVEACRESARPYDWVTSIAPRYVQVYEEALERRR